MTAKYHPFREEVDGFIIAGTMSEYSATRWTIEFEIVKDGRIVAPIWEDRSRTYSSYSDAAEAIVSKAKARLVRQRERG